MDSNLSYFSLPFVDSPDLDFGKIRGAECDYDDLHPTLPSHGSLLEADDDVLAQFLSGDDPLEDLNGPTTLHCEICKKKFDNAKKYYGHLRVHSKDNLWICEKCPNERFSTKQQLMKHSLSHQPLERAWRCPQCEMSFEALWRLQQHLFAKHLDYRPHKCDTCSKTFHKLSDLDKHKDVHLDRRRHACSVCEKKFVDRSNLNRHMTTHGPEKPHPCPGCGRRFKQLASMRRHSMNCRRVNKNTSELKKSHRSNHCRVCGLTFQYKSSLLEHCVREHSDNPTQPPPEKPKEDKSNELYVDTNRTVDNIVDDILAAEDDYMTMSTQNDLTYPTEENTDNIMQIELMKEMNQMHILDDELLYNDIDLDTFQTMYNTIDYERNELFDLNDGRSMDIINGRSLDQDLMNSLVKFDQPKDDVPKFNPQDMNTKVNEFLNPPVSVSECATIFESDVDLEASTNLAANLNQLIGENTVQYIATENDDTFIISLNNEIDPEQLMLNIGVDSKLYQIPKEPSLEVPVPDLVPIEPKPLNVATKEPEKVKTTRARIMYVCLKCKKIFKTKFNYTSHRGIHDSSLQQFKCNICSKRYSYKSTLNKHIRNSHLPIVKKPHMCSFCDMNYDHAWRLKQHIERDHKGILPYQCELKDCGKKFFKKCDLESHQRFHSGEKPYVCNVCSRGFKTTSHLSRHVRNVDCTKYVIKKQNEKEPPKVAATVVTSAKKPEENKAKSLLVKNKDSKIEAKSANSSLVKAKKTKIEAISSNSLLVKDEKSKIKTKTVKKMLASSQNSKIEHNKVKSLLVSQNSKIEHKPKTAKSLLKN